ncbi:hypothetical protein CsSME_00050136 [Camellia sinensis var. sinensis]
MSICCCLVLSLSYVYKARNPSSSLFPSLCLEAPKVISKVFSVSIYLKLNTPQVKASTFERKQHIRANTTT